MSWQLLDSTLILLTYSGYLAVGYILLFVIDRSLIKRKTNFLFITIILMMVVVTYGAFKALSTLPLGQHFIWLVFFGTALAVIAEVLLWVYKILIGKENRFTNKLIPKWYLDISLARCFAVTVVYGLLVSIPIAFHLTTGNTLYTTLLASLFTILVIFRAPVVDLAKRYGFWFRS